MKNIHCMSGLGQGYATRFVYRPSVALFFDDTRLTNPDTSGATTTFYHKPNIKNHLKQFGRAK